LYILVHVKVILFINIVSRNVDYRVDKHQAFGPPTQTLLVHMRSHLGPTQFFNGVIYPPVGGLCVRAARLTETLKIVPCMTSTFVS